MSETEETVEPPEKMESTPAAEENYQEKYLRLLAEGENMRKRLQKERQDFARLSVEQMAADFLPAMDNLEQALKFADQMSPEVKNWAMGFRMILSQMQDVLTQHGILPFDSIGKPFDPHLHEAVEMVATDEHPRGIVVREMVRGYRSRERTVRAARVAVSKALEQEEPKPE